ncbi:MAG: amidase domain-containing protein [Paenibacillaceae bacterium]|jgi:cell wall-associated NlpC family hydrolase|nr:amidase domain-containing protein [Paenibacillaceae bacterium]
MAYDRREAVVYARRHWNFGNAAYERFATDCTNFVSQCLFAGGIAMDYTDRRSTGWWYVGRSVQGEQWSFSWAVAQALYGALRAGAIRTMRVTWVRRVEELSLGDVIFYDFHGSGRIAHSVIVTTPGADALVHAHTSDVRDRPWHYRDSIAWTPAVRYAFAHIDAH